MKINPVKKYSGILPAAAALLGSIVTSCDRQNVVGSVPNPNPKDVPSQLPGEPPELPADTTTEPEELPQMLSGDVPIENIQQDAE